MNFRYPDLLNHHGCAFLFFVLVATLFLWDVLFLQYSLGAFDIILNQPSWKGEFTFEGIHQPILSDSPTAHYPQREFDWGQVRRFSNPEFNPYILSGVPWSAQGAGAFVTSLPQLVMNVGNAIDWSTWLRLVLAGTFMYFLVVELGLTRLAGIFAGILWSYNLHQVVWLEFPQHLATQLWIPLLFLFNLRILSRGPELISVAWLLVANVLFFTSGYTQIVLYTYISIGIFNTAYVLLRPGRDGFLVGLRRWVGVHAIYVAAVLLCAVGVLAEVQYISEGLRGAQDWRGRSAPPELSLESIAGLFYSFFPRISEVTQVLNPDYYGGIWEGRYRFEKGNIVETGRYFGVLGVLFAVSVLLVAWRARHLRLIGVFAVTMALLFSLFYRHEFSIGLLRLIPFADKGSYSRFITLLTFFGCVLAGFGFHYVLGARIRWLYVSMGLMLVAVLLAWFQLEEFTVSKMWYPAAIIAGLAVVAGAREVLGFDWRWVGWVVVGVATLDLYITGADFNTRMENERLFPKNNTIRYLLNDPEPFRVAVISDKPLYHPNILSFYDIPVVEGYSTVLPVEYSVYIDELFPKDHVTRNGILFLMEPNVKALRLMNVKYVLSDRPLNRKHDGLEHVIDSNDHSIYRIKDSVPRIFCASDVVYVNDDEDQLGKYKKRLNRSDTPVVVTGLRANETFTGRCRIDDLRVYTQRVTAAVEAEESRYVVIPYPFSDNWTVKIDGTDAVPVKANGYHMAVRVPQGGAKLDILYRNPWSEVSAWVFIAAGFGLLLLAWRIRGAGRIPRLVLSGVAVVVVFKSSLSLPALQNDRIPERVAPEQPYEVVRQGRARVERELHSERVSAGSPVEYPLGIESAGLTRLSLLAGTFHQRRLSQEVTVEILDQQGDVIVREKVPGHDIVNNNWFTIKFPAISEQMDLRIRVSTLETDMSKSFILWLDPNGDICVRSFYRFSPEYGVR